LASAGRLQIPTAQPLKRSSHVALLLMSSFAIAGGAYALPRENCAPTGSGMAAPSLPQTGAECPPFGSFARAFSAHFSGG
jgi:hypothetical protein